MEESKAERDVMAGEVQDERATAATEADAIESPVENEATPSRVAPAAAEAPAADAALRTTEGDDDRTPAADAAAPAPQSVSTVQPGDLLRGVIRRVEDDLIVVDVGYKADGVVPRSELTLAQGQSPKELFEVNDPIYVSVLSVDPRDGALLLSERRARAERAWDDLEEALQTGRIIKAPVIEAVKGGLVVDVGIRAFMPASHVERGYVSDLSKYVGTVVRARVIELDRTKNRVILSQKVVLEEEYQRQREQTWASLAEGQIRTGIVKGITDFGAFVDLGGVDGLLHVSELAWNRVDHPSDVVSEGQEIRVKVLKVDRERERISLSLKQTLPDPWADVQTRYPVGTVVEGTVVRLAPFGAFVRLEPGVEGLVHISQLADHHVKTPEEVVREGDQVRVKVLKVQPAERRVSLSIKEAQAEARATAAGESPTAAEEPKPGAGKPSPARQRPRQAQRERARGVEPTGEQSEPARDGVTLGEMFGDLFQETRERLMQQRHQQKAVQAETVGDGDDTSARGSDQERVDE